MLVRGERGIVKNTRRQFLKAAVAAASGAALPLIDPGQMRAAERRVDWKRSVRVGLHQAGWDIRRPEVFFRAAAELGADGVELAPPWLEKFHDMEALCQTLRACGTHLAPAIFVGGQEVRNPDRRDKFLKKARKWARWIRSHGGRYVIYSTVAGAGPRRTEQERKAVADGFDRIADVVAGEGCTPLYHNHYVRSCPESRRLLEEDLELLDWSRWRLCVDTGHLVLAMTDPVAFVRRWRGKIAWMHCKDVKTRNVEIVDQPGVRWQDQFTPLGTGVVDFPAIIALLADSGYDGWLIVEQDASPDPRATAQKSLEYLRGVINSL